ncbi:Uncharacterised protein [Prevotella disiens]|uniref:Rod shape-determining protein MreD n=1 Tax=Prevotella disiens TaxID=28130 RepID=A0A379EGV6_9BACT|nr:Uncharacterised protein [Prevotella disiens]
MSIDFVKSLAWFLVLVLAQVFVLNHIHLFGIATPLLYIFLYFYLEGTFHIGQFFFQALSWVW